ncbi:MAG: tRNA pseudouridine(55) synthase TruB [Acidimicrobiia bacterium]
MTRGFLVIDKPGGMTSTAVVTRVKGATGAKKVGHAGTLDPMATGMLVVALGRATRLIRYIQEQPKEYIAAAMFGVATDTLDSDGAVISREPMSFTLAELREVAERFVGTTHQVPPMVSALKHQGRRLYELARQGEVIEREARPVEIHELEISSVGSEPYPEVRFRVVCGKGTYVRSLADDLAGALGGAAHLTELRRTRTGRLAIDRDGISFQALDHWRDRIIDPAQALDDLPAVTVGAETRRGVCNGMPFVGGEMVGMPEDSAVRVLDAEGVLLAVYRRRGDQARPEVVIGS